MKSREGTSPGGETRPFINRKQIEARRRKEALERDEVMEMPVMTEEQAKELEQRQEEAAARMEMLIEQYQPIMIERSIGWEQAFPIRQKKKAGKTLVRFSLKNGALGRKWIDTKKLLRWQDERSWLEDAEWKLTPGTPLKIWRKNEEQWVNAKTGELLDDGRVMLYFKKEGREAKKPFPVEHVLHSINLEPWTFEPEDL